MLPTVSEPDLRRDSGRKFCCPGSALNEFLSCQICLEDPSLRNKLKTKKEDLGIKHENMKGFLKINLFPKQLSKTNNIYSVPGTVQTTLQILIHLTLIITLWGRCYSPNLQSGKLSHKEVMQLAESHLDT